MNYNERYNEFDRRCDCNQNNDYDYNTKRPCCVKRVEETFCCYPSYYNEEKKEEKKEKQQEYWEGTFKIYPKKECDKRQDNDYKHENRCERKEDNHECCRNHNRCCLGLCNLFRNCRW